MTDALAERCAGLAANVVPLMGAAIESQGKPAALEEVIESLAGVRAVVQSSDPGAAGPAYRDWAAVAVGLIDEMDAAARDGDAATVWALFTDKANGFHRLGAICAGYPGW